MISALIYLQACSFKNRLLSRFRRLKQPKYLLGAIAGGLYFWFYFIRFWFVPRPHGQLANAGLLAIDPLLAESLAALVLFVILLASWLLPNKRAALAFTEAEVAFLFPAPISRSGLIHYKLVRSQTAILFTTLFLTLFSGRWRAGGLVWITILGWWAVLSTLNLHFLAASFVRTKLLDRGITHWQRRAGVLVLVVAVIIGVGLWAKATLPPLETANLGDKQLLSAYAGKLLTAGPATYLLFPCRLVVRPFLARDALAFLAALGPALLMMALHYAWVVRSNVAFEEASVEASQKLAERIAAVRAGKWQGLAGPKKAKRAPFKLRPIGPPAVALLWKNVIAAGQSFSARLWFLLVWITVFPAVMIATMLKDSPGLFILGAFVLVILSMTFLMGPQLMRQDLRQDLAVADALKLYPMRGWQIVLGEILAPVVILTAIQWLLILLAVPFFVPPDKPLGLATRVAFGAGLAILAPVFNLVLLLIPNAAALLFPGWVRPGREMQRGIETTGQALILMVGQLLAFVLALLPAAAAGAIVFFLAPLLIGWVAAVPLTALVAAVVLLAECGVGIWLLGKLFERFDLSAELNA